MGNLFLKVVLIGSEGVGKTELTPWSRSSFSYSDIVGTDIAIYTTVVPTTNKKVKLQIWEINLEKRFDLVRDTLWSGTMGAILVWDVTDRASFLEVKDWWIKLRSSIGEIPVLGVANKTDLVERREVSTEEGLSFCSENGFEYIESNKERRADFEHALVELAARVAIWLEENK